jgi:hypothetical protein
MISVMKMSSCILGTTELYRIYALALCRTFKGFVSWLHVLNLSAIWLKHEYIVLSLLLDQLLY